MKFSENVSVYIKTTDTCQLNCKHCYTSGSDGRKIIFDPFRTIAFLKDFKESYPEVKHVSFSFHGGEPMLAPVHKMMTFRHLAREIFDSCDFRIQTNLVYELTGQKTEFLKSLDSVGTSWDADLRFDSELQLSLWLNNVQKLVKEELEMTMVTCLSKQTIELYKPEYIIGWAADLGFKYILFERLTPSGNAMDNDWIFPSNDQLDRYILDMYNQTVEHKLYDRIHNMFFQSIMNAYVHRQHQGCRTRSCERNVITINATGTIGGCPDTASYMPYGKIDQSAKEVFESDKRAKNIACEMCRNEECYGCPVFNLCNGDCHQLKWDDTCPAPKRLMYKMMTEEDAKTYEKFII